MNPDTRKWISKDGEDFLRGIGIKRGQTVLDFGSGSGHYTIPAAKVVGDGGKVYAFDKDGGVLNELGRIIEQEGIKNVKLVRGETKVFLKDDTVDVVLCYDVIHYSKRRKVIYNEVRRLLKDSGFFSLYPKHYKQDFPLMELAVLGLEDIVKEVEEAGFVLKDRLSTECLHDNYYNECFILNFVPRDK